MKKYMIKQLSVFLENKKGELTDVTAALSKESISIKSLLLIDSTDFGILRLIVGNPDKARDILVNAGYTVKINQVFAVKTEDEIGSFNGVATILSQKDINILYTYAFINENAGIFVFKVERSDFNIAVGALQAGNIKIVEHSFFY